MFDVPGRIVERVTLPAGTDLLEVGAGHLVPLEEDELDVEAGDGLPASCSEERPTDPIPVTSMRS